MNLEDYKNYAISTGKSANTVTNYISRIKRTELVIGKPSEEMGFTDLHKMLSVLTQEGAKPATRKGYLDAYKSYWKYLKKFGYEDITADIDKVKVERVPPKVPLKEELEAMLKEAERFPRDYAILVTFITTGLRISELADMKWENTNGDRAVIRGKGSKWRTVYLHPSCLEAINNYKRGGEYVFERYTGGPLTPRAIHNVVKKYTTYSAHKLRHYFGTSFYEKSGYNLRETQEVLGHSSPATTQIYVHVAQERIKQTMTSGGIL